MLASDESELEQTLGERKEEIPRSENVWAPERLPNEAFSEAFIEHSSPLIVAKKIYFIALSLVFRNGREFTRAPDQSCQIIKKQICANISANKHIKIYSVIKSSSVIN